MPIRLTPRALMPWLLIVAAGGVAAAVRLLYIEPAAIGDTCEAHAQLWWCSLRTLLVEGFYYDIYGWAACAAAIGAL